MRALLGLLLLATACDKVLGLKEDKDRKFDATVTIDAPDDARPDAAVVGCGPNNLLHTSFVDSSDFNAEWNEVTELGSTTAIVDHALALTTGVPKGYAQATTNRAHNFIGGVAVVKLVDMPIKDRVESSFQMGLSANTEYFFLIDSSGGTSGELRMTARLNGSDSASLPIGFNPTAHRFLRFRHDMGTNRIHFETSENGTDYISRFNTNVIFDLAAITFTLGVGSYTTAADTSPVPVVTARFDDFDFCRP